MRTTVKEWCCAEAIILTTILVITNLGNADVSTLIPENPQEVESWFDKLVTPISQRTNVMDMDMDIVEAEKAAETITVRKDGSGKFKSIVEALNTVETGNKRRIVIDIGPGDYEEKIKVESSKPYVTFYGNPEAFPTIVFGGTAETDGGLSDCATLSVDANNFVGLNLIIKNSAPPPDDEIAGQQGVALRVSGEKVVFYNCRIHGSQNTIFDDEGLHLFKNCTIEGTTDLIIGGAKSMYLSSVLRVENAPDEGTITGNARKSTLGFSFVHCTITGTGSGNKTYLGRPWASASHVVFSFCEMSDVVKPEGWTIITPDEDEKTVFFGEYKNKGAGAKTDQRVKFAKQLTENEAQEFISMDFIEARRWLLPKPTTLPPPALEPSQEL